MNPLQYYLVLRAHRRIALLVALATLAAVLLGSYLLPRRYTAETAVMVDVRSPDPVAAVLLPAAVLPGSLGTQVEIIRSDRVARKVVALLGLGQNQTVRQMWLDATKGRGKLDDWMAELLQKGLAVTPSRDSNVINIAYRGADPAFAAAVANGFAQAYIDASVELRVEPAKQYLRWFGEQSKQLRENVEKAQSRLSAYQQASGIVASDEALDYELAKLNDLAARLTAAQADTRDAQTKRRSGSGASDALPEVMQNSVVQSLRTEIAQREAKLKEAAGNLGAQHPQYQRMQAELAELKSRLALENTHVASGFSASTAVGRSREAELKQAIEAQKRRLLGLKKDRDEIAVLLRDVDTAKKAYEAVTTRYNQTSLESQATQTNVSVLSPAVEPLEPSFPKPLPQTILIAIALAIVAGFGTAYLREMFDRRVRSAADLADVLRVPLLGVIGRAKARRRLPFWRGAAALVAK
jgi:succinoglycan biosynthesis transport protein ExoP